LVACANCDVGAARPGVTGPGVTGPGVTGPGFTGPGSTGPGSTGPGVTGPGVTAQDFAATDKRVAMTLPCFRRQQKDKAQSLPVEHAVPTSVVAMVMGVALPATAIRHVVGLEGTTVRTVPFCVFHNADIGFDISDVKIYLSSIDIAAEAGCRPVLSTGLTGHGISHTDRQLEDRLTGMETRAASALGKPTWWAAIVVARATGSGSSAEA
jgi:hypothetical protein